MSDLSSNHTLVNRLLEACVGSCTCLTKTPDIEHHDEKCTYRLHYEAWLALAGRVADEPPECQQCDELIGERDRAQEALQDAHIALGGDGEWKGKLPPEPAPDSGDLHFDVPELARERMAELERLRASQPPPEPHVIKQIEHALQDNPADITRGMADYIRGCISDYRHSLTKETSHD